VLNASSNETRNVKERKVLTMIKIKKAILYALGLIYITNVISHVEDAINSGALIDWIGAVAAIIGCIIMWIVIIAYEGGTKHE
jgi:hypothetical protein